MSATVSRVADRWHVSITVDTMDARPPLPKAENELQDEDQVTGEFRHSQNQGAAGVNLGVKALATLSTGEVKEGPKAHTALLQRLRRVSRVSVWFNAVLRGDNNPIRVGAESNIQDEAVLHTDSGFPLVMGATLLNRCRIGQYTIIGAHALIPEGKRSSPTAY